MNINDKHIIGIKVSALIEILLFLSITVIASYIFSDGNRFINISPHPFWIILLLIIVQYDLRTGFLCVGLMILFLYIGNMPERHLTDTSIEYFFKVSWRPFLWFITTAILGAIRERKIRETQYFKDRVQELKNQTGILTDSYNKMKAKKEHLETRLAGELETAIKIYRAARSLENLDQENRYQVIVDIINDILSPKKFSIFILEENSLKLKINSGWKETDNYTKNFEDTTDLYREIVVNHKNIEVLDKSNGYILQNEGIIAAPIMDINSGEVLGMLKIEDMNFESLNNKTVSIFNMLSEWIGLALNNLRKLEIAKSSSMIDLDYNIFSYQFLKQQTDFLKGVAERFDLYLANLNIQIDNIDELEMEERRNATYTLSQGVTKCLRKIDCIFFDKRRPGLFSILLFGKEKINISKVIEKLQQQLQTEGKNLVNTKFSFNVEELHSKEWNSD